MGVPLNMRANDSLFVPPLRECGAVELDPEFRRQLALAHDLASAILAEGGRALVVGGYARDAVLRHLGRDAVPKDIDVEVYGLDYPRLRELLDRFGSVNMVGAQFGILKVEGLDVSLPRRDSKVGPGHRGIEITGDPSMSIQEAARRRDFTINALAMDPLTGEVFDFYGGIPDLRRGVVRATDPELFRDDPLRALRAAQFGSRFGFAIEPETMDICRTMPVAEVTVERIGDEWRKMLLKSVRPSVGLELMRQMLIMGKLHPPLQAIVGVEQDPVWHPEGDVWTHTLMVVDAAAAIAAERGLDDEGRLVVILAAVTHDLGKATTSFRRDDGRIVSPGHAVAGEGPARAFMDSIDTPRRVTERVIPLVREHLFPTIQKDASESAVRRLSVRLHPASIRELVWIAEADHRGRGIDYDGFPQGQALLDKAEALEVKLAKPRELLRGHGDVLIAHGMVPGPAFGAVLRQVYDLQLSGEICEIDQAMAKALELWGHRRS